MKLLPAVIFVLVLFLAGSFFLQARRTSRRPGFDGASSGQMRKVALIVGSIAMLALSGILFMLLGRIAILIALLALSLFFLSSRKR